MERIVRIDTDTDKMPEWTKCLVLGISHQNLPDACIRVPYNAHIKMNTDCTALRGSRKAQRSPTRMDARALKRAYRDRAASAAEQTSIADGFNRRKPKALIEIGVEVE